jgi:hypothetical protein
VVKGALPLPPPAAISIVSLPCCGGCCVCCCDWEVANAELLLSPPVVSNKRKMDVTSAIKVIVANPIVKTDEYDFLVIFSRLFCHFISFKYLFDSVAKGHSPQFGNVNKIRLLDYHLLYLMTSF